MNILHNKEFLFIGLSWVLTEGVGGAISGFDCIWISYL